MPLIPSSDVTLLAMMDTYDVIPVGSKRLSSLINGYLPGSSTITKNPLELITTVNGIIGAMTFVLGNCDKSEFDIEFDDRC
jgi:hypothetical protein